VFDDTLRKMEGLSSYGWDLLSFDSLSDWSSELLAIRKSALLDRTLGKCQKTMDSLGERMEALAESVSNREEPTPAPVIASAKTKGKKAAAEVEDTEEGMLYDPAVSNP
jgi:hypothetical protein